MVFSIPWACLLFFFRQLRIVASYVRTPGNVALNVALCVRLEGNKSLIEDSGGPGAETTADAVQQPAGHVGKPEDIASMVMYLCSDKAGFITGENICIDGGMTRLMIYHGDNGWTYEG